MEESENDMIYFGKIENDMTTKFSSTARMNSSNDRQV